MKLTKRDAVLIIALVGVIAAVCSYFLVYKPYTEKTAMLEQEITELEKRVSELQKLKDNEALYIEETGKMSEEIEAIYQQFPVDIHAEDIVMFAVDLQNGSDLDIATIGMAEPEMIYELGKAQAEAEAAAAAAKEAEAAAAAATTEEAAATETEEQPATTAPAAPVQPENPKNLYRKQTVLSYQASYDDFKRGLTQILSDPDKLTIEAVTASFDEGTGLLRATTTFNQYYLTGINKEYVPTTIPFIPQGRDNLFGTKATP